LDDTGLSLEEKVSLLGGKDAWRLPDVERAGIPSLVMTDGPSGARGQSFISGRSFCFPCGTALAATWDPDLVRQVGVELGRETRRVGAHVLLGPTVNLHRHPLGGRNFECFSEDPLLTGRMAAAYITGVQSAGASCCVKHLACNDSEFQRHTIDSQVDEGVLRELYLLPFEYAVRAGVWAIMAAYNKLNGTHAAEHPWLLTQVLRGDWGFDGVVVSDWFATHSTTEALTAGLDLEMPGPVRYRGPAAVAAVHEDRLPEEAVDRSARRVLRLIARTQAPPSGVNGRSSQATGGAVTGLLRTAAARGMVLLKNDGALPVSPGSIRSLAVIGTYADGGQFQGGGSAQVSPSSVSAILPALRAAFGDEVDVMFERACLLPQCAPPLGSPNLRTGTGAEGAVVEYRRRSAPQTRLGDPEIARDLHLTWLGSVVSGHDDADVRVQVSASITAAEPGRHTLCVAGMGTIRVQVDGQLVLEHEGRPAADSPFTLSGAESRVQLDLVQGTSRALFVEFDPPPAKGIARLELGLLPPAVPAMADRAVAAAAAADAVVFVAGSPPGWETEGQDRSTMALAAPQDELIERVTAANPRTIVVMNTGAPYAMPWVTRAAAVLQAWFPGQELGAALGDILTGAVNPSGKLPVTFPVAASDMPSDAFYPGADGVVRYGEGLNLGYRRLPGTPAVAPLFPFGHGLSYSTFCLGPATLRISGDRLDIDVPVTNTAGPAGREVVQLYVSAGNPGRPELELKGFAAVTCDPGETRVATITVPVTALRIWSDRGWEFPQWPLTARIGTSSACLPIALALPDLSGFTLTGK
jgi:beta-glucosidase